MKDYIVIILVNTAYSFQMGIALNTTDCIMKYSANFNRFQLNGMTLLIIFGNYKLPFGRQETHGG